MTETEKRPKRKAISKTLRFEVFKRDSFKCQYCGAHPPSVVLHVDHILAVSRGGTNVIDNLVAACQPCNSGKGVRNLSTIPQSLAEKASDVAEREDQLRGYQDILEARRERLDAECWRVLEAIYGPLEKAKNVDYLSVQRFIEAIGVHRALDAVDKSLGSNVSPHNRFRYFCGICWAWIKGGS